MDARLFLIRRTEAEADRQSQQQLETLDLAISSLLDQNQPVKALDLITQSLHLRQSLYGATSSEVISYTRNITRKIVISAVKLMDSSDVQKPLVLLQKVESMMQRLPTSKLVAENCDVYNNIACAYRKQGRLQLAKKYILKALKLAAVYREVQVDRAATHLNMCAILSGMSQHSAALDYGLKAIQYAQEDLVNVSLKGKSDAPHKVTVLAVAYHNAGVEEEHLGHREAALVWYEKAVKFIEMHGGDLHKQIKKEFERTYKSALKNIAETAKPDLRPSHPTRPRPVSASKPSRHFRPVISPVLDSEESFYTSERPPLLQTTSHTHFRSSLPGRKKSPTGTIFPEFNLRDPLEGKPQTFEAIKKQKTQPRATANRGKRTFTRPVQHLVAESDEDLRELEAMGLMDYSLEPTRRDPAKGSSHRSVRRIRGKRKLARSPGRQQDLPRQPSDTHTETPVMKVQTTHIPQEHPGSLDPTELPDPETQEKAAIRIQAVYRGAAVRRNMQVYSGKLVGRQGKRLNNGHMTVVSVYKMEGSEGKIVAKVGDRELEMRVQSDKWENWREIVDKVDIIEGKLAILPTFKPESDKNLVKIQAIFRGFLARRRVKYLKTARNRSKSVLYRGVHHSGHTFTPLTISLDTATHTTFISTNTHEIPVPSVYSSFSLQELLSLVHVQDGKVELGKKNTGEVDEVTVTRLQSIIRMRKQQGQYEVMKAKQAKSRERLFQREITLHDSPYLLSLTRLPSLTPPSIEVEAYPIHSISFMPKKTLYDEVHLLSVYGYKDSGELTAHSEEMLGEVLIEGGAAVLRKLTPAFRPLDYVTYREFTGKLCEVEFKAENKRVEMRVKVDASGEVVGLGSEEEDKLREMVGVEQGWLPRHCEALATRLVLREGRVEIGEGKPTAPSVTVTVQTTSEANVTSTDAYIRIPSSLPPPVHSYHQAATVIQSHIRRFLSKSHSRPSPSSPVLYQTYQKWSDGRVVAIQVTKLTKNSRQIHVIDLNNHKNYYLNLENETNNQNYEQICSKLWTFGDKLYVFSVNNINPRYKKAEIVISRYIRGYFARKMMHSYRKFRENQVILCKKQTFDGEILGVFVNLREKFVFVEIFPLTKTAKGKKLSKTGIFPLKDLIFIPLNGLNLSEILSFLSFSDQKIALKSVISPEFLSKSVIVSEKVSISGLFYTILMCQNYDLVEFWCFLDGEKSGNRLELSLMDVNRITGLGSQSLSAQGSVIIRQFLRVSERHRVEIDENRGIVGLGVYVGRIQAAVRGFLARRRLVGKRRGKWVITTGEGEVNGGRWKLTAYLEKPYIRVEACREGKVVSALISEQKVCVPGISLEMVIQTVVFPRLYLEDGTNGPHLRVLRSAHSDPAWLSSHLSPVYLTEGQENSATEESNSPSDRLIPSHSSSAREKDLVLRSGVDLQGRYVVVSMFGREMEVGVEVSDPDSHEKTFKSFPVPLDTDIDRHCNELLPRIRLSQGCSLDFDILPPPSPVLEVLYKKSHYISDRYFTITFSNTSSGVIITADDPQHSKTLQLKLGKCGGLSAEALQREIAVIAKRLRVQEVLGEETLVLAGS